MLDSPSSCYDSSVECFSSPHQSILNKSEFNQSPPLLRWAGSKKKLLPLLQSAAPESYSRYVEPFFGSGVLFLKLNSKRALLSDLNPDLIQAYDMVRKAPRTVWEVATSFSTEVDNYYVVRSMNAEDLEPITRAARFIYLNRFCFNGVYRTNRKGQFNVSRGKGELSIPSLKTFELFSEKISGTDLKCIDFEATVNKCSNNDFIYLDPPYAIENKRDRGEYGPGSFKVADLERLITSIRQASSRGAHVLLSYAADSILIEKMADWHIHELSVTRNVSGFTGGRRKAQEVLISNYAWQ